MDINLKLLHITNLSPHISFVLFATNMRYARDNVRSKHFQEPLLNTVSQPPALWNNLDDEDGDDDEDQDE